MIRQPGAENSSLLMNTYPLKKTQSLDSSGASYPFREKLKYNSQFTPTYADHGLDAMAEKIGFKVRELWRETSGLKDNETYVISPLPYSFTL